MRRILYWLDLVDLVWTIDHGGEVRLRVVRTDIGTGKRYVYGIQRLTVGELQDDYTISRPEFTTRQPYMQNWRPYQGPHSRPHMRPASVRLTWRRATR